MARYDEAATIDELDEALASLVAARTVANPIRREMLDQRIDALLDERLVRGR